MSITWLKYKHRKRKPTQQGYRHPSDNGDQGTKHQHKRKAPEAQKVAIRQRQPKKVMVLSGSKTRMHTREEG